MNLRSRKREEPDMAALLEQLDQKVSERMMPLLAEVTWYREFLDEKGLLQEFTDWVYLKRRAKK